MVLPISARGADTSNAGQRRGALGERLQGDLDARGDDPAEVLALGGHGVVGDRGAEVHHHARPPEALVGGDGVDEPVGADLAGVVVADRHARLDAGSHREHLVPEVPLGHRAPFGPSTGTVEETIEASIWPIATWRSSSRLRSAAPSWSEVDWRTVAKRQCSRSSGVAEHPEVGLGVTDIHGEQHGEPLCWARK